MKHRRSQTSGRRHGAYDVVVAGGGAAGVGAACAAAATGARTLLLERTAALGGAATARTVSTYCGLYTCTAEPKQAVAGVADRVLASLRETGGVSDLIVIPFEGSQNAIVTVDPESVKWALDQVCAESGIDVLFGSIIAGATREDDQITRITFSDYWGARIEVETGAAVDATGDATMTLLAGAGTTSGNGGRRQTATLGVRYAGIDRSAEISTDTLGAAVREAIAAGQDGLTSSNGFVGRLPLSSDVVAYLADADLDALDATGYSAATRNARKQAWGYLRVLRTLPGCECAYIVSAGPELGIRESRHLLARKPVVDDTLHSGAVGPDTVALAAWPSEFHPGAGRASEWEYIGGDGVFGVTLDNIRSADTRNLFGAGRVIGGDLRAGASVRVMGTSFATGQAAGVAAALGDRQAEELLSATRTELRRQGALLAL